MAQHRLNKVIDKLIHGEVVVSSAPVPNGSFEIAQNYGDSDFDMVIFEMEHHGFDFIALRSSLHAMMNRGRILQDGAGPSVVPLTRIPPNARETSQWIIKQALDVGVYGLVTPKLETPEEALAIVTASRYPAQRGRDLGGGQRGLWAHVAARYWGLSTPEYVERSDVWPANPDGEVLIIGIVESALGVENIERILDATNGIGVIWPGFSCLAADMGLMGQPDHPEVLEAMSGVLAACATRSVPCVGVGVDLPQAVLRVNEGYQVIATPLLPGIAGGIRAAAAARSATGA
jgi:4-hydroxy-2-oxoheptanedioate aldolase